MVIVSRSLIPEVPEIDTEVIRRSVPPNRRRLIQMANLNGDIGKYLSPKTRLSSEMVTRAMEGRVENNTRTMGARTRRNELKNEYARTHSTRNCQHHAIRWTSFNPSWSYSGQDHIDMTPQCFLHAEDGFDSNPNPFDLSEWYLLASRRGLTAPLTYSAHRGRF